MSFKNVVEPEELVPTYRCPCCKYKTLRGRGQDEICPVCYRHDDGQHEQDAEVIRRAIVPRGPAAPAARPPTGDRPRGGAAHRGYGCRGTGGAMTAHQGP